MTLKYCPQQLFTPISPNVLWLFPKVIFSVFCFPADLPCNYQRAVFKPFHSCSCSGNFLAQTLYSWNLLALKQPDCARTVSTQHKTSTLTVKKRGLLVDRHVTETMVKQHPQEEAVWGRNPHTLLLYCLEQWGQHTGGVAMVPVSCVWVLSIGSGSPGPAGRSFRMLGGSSAPGWFFRMCALRLLALLYTCRAKTWN